MSLEENSYTRRYLEYDRLAMWSFQNIIYKRIILVEKFYDILEIFQIN